MRRRAAELTETDPARAKLMPEGVYTPARLVPLLELAADGEVSADGSELGEQRSLAFNVHAVLVAVDPRTGVVRILQSIQTADAGF
ncbi:hypoxanthine oxidase, partial [Streptomyces brasiliscabiei]